MCQLDRPFQEGDDPTEEDQGFVEGEPIQVPIEPKVHNPRNDPAARKLEARLTTILGSLVASAQLLYTAAYERRLCRHGSGCPPHRSVGIRCLATPPLGEGCSGEPEGMQRPALPQPCTSFMDDTSITNDSITIK